MTGKSKKQQNPHDHAYKLLFSHPEMIADLLRGYVRQPWVEQLDFSTLKRANPEHITGDLREREHDMVWQVKWTGDDERWLYIYLLLEFQSTPDKFMALRLMTYLGLLYQDLTRTKQLTHSGKLPPVLPIVLYNGERRWQAATSIETLIDTIPGGLEAYRPGFSYLLLDEGQYADDPLPATRNLVSGLFSLENSRSPHDVQAVLEHLISWLSTPEQTELRRNFTVWLKRVLLPARMDGINFDQLNDLQEVNAMLAERVKNWDKEPFEKGMEKGLEQGLEKGRLDAELTTLTRQLTRRFGPLDEAVQQRLKQASHQQLEQWLDNILDAKTLDEVFG